MISLVVLAHASDVLENAFNPLSDQVSFLLLIYDLTNVSFPERQVFT